MGSITRAWDHGIRAKTLYPPPRAAAHSPLGPQGPGHEGQVAPGGN